jgi:cell division protein FtsI (penicillin-binding protein 3)
LALSVEVGSVYAHPRQIKEKAKTARSLSLILKERHSNILNLLESKSPFVWIKRRIDPDQAKKVDALDLEGVEITTETRRYYPEKEVAAHLIGFAGTDNQGLEGLEKRYEEYLRGPQYSIIQMRDAMGRSFSISRPIPSGRGMRNLILTIDRDIQYKVQQALKSAVKKARAKGGHCLVVDPGTGEILAMAVVPEFNPNIFSKYKPYQWRNRAITDCFEPGSTIKAFLLAASLEERIVTPDTQFDCEHGKYAVGAHVIHDCHEYGVLSVADIVRLSSNIGAIKIGKKLGYATFCEYLRKFGFGSKTRIDLLGEREGFVRSIEKTRELDRTTLFFGHGMSTTSLQLAMAMAAIANGGKLMRPYVVKAVIDESGRKVKETSPEVVRRVLEGVVSREGTGTRASIEGFRVAGKTGTSQKVDPKTKRYSKTKYEAIFVGFVPVNKPKLVILVMIDEPKGVSYGGVVAAPVFKEVGQWSLSHLRVNPETNPPSIAFASQSYPSAGDGGRTQTRMNGLVHQIAIELREESVSGEPGVLPDFSGLGIREVLKRTRSLGLEVLFEGSGLAVKQHPKPGASLQRIKTVKVSFRSPT